MFMRRLDQHLVHPWIYFAASLVLLGCGTDSQTPSSADVTQVDGVTLDGGAAGQAADGQASDGGVGGEQPEAAALYAPKHLVIVDIELPTADWDTLRKQQRDMTNFLNPGCREVPFESGFTYQKATVWVDGVKLSDVGVRKKGFVGSMSEVKPSLKLKFNAFAKGQLLHGMERMTLNNNRQDLGFVRSCLAYQLFAQAGVPTPRCNFAHVRVNGVSLGLFSHVETVKRRFLRRHFSSAKGHLYEGTLSDFRPGWLDTLEPKTSDTDAAHPALAALTKALALPDDELLPALEKIIDLPAFLRFWAMEVLVNHTDGYGGNANNFFVYIEPESGLLHFIPWGPDLSFVDRSFEDPKAPSAVLTRSRLTRRLYQHTEGQKRYLAALKQVSEDVWDTAALTKEIDRMTKLTAPAVAEDKHTPNPEVSVPKAVADTKAWILARQARIDEVLTTPPAWSYPETGLFCFTKVITAKGTFATTFGTQGASNAFLVGKGTVAGTSPEGPFDIKQCGSTSGYPDDQPGKAAVTLVFQHPTNKQIFVILSLLTAKENFQSGLSVPLSSVLGGGGGFMFTFHSETKQFAPVAAVWSGILTFESASLTNGATVKGSFETDLVEFGDTP